MAAKKPVRPDFIQTANRASKEAREAFEFDLNRRLTDQKRILSADDLSGLYDPKRALFTTIDGKPRPLTFDDLLAFKAAVRDLRSRHKGKAFLGGIKPKQVIDLSRAEDRERARTEIHTAMPVANRGNVVHFQTNSGPNSDVRRHHVYVQFLNYDAAVASPVAPAKVIKEMTTGNIKFDCDCGRHTFWFRFSATIGGFNYGRNEDGFPRIRNPKLYGVACKHVLRVMALIGQSGVFNGFAARMIEHGRKTLTPTRRIVTAKELAELAAQLKKESSKKRQIKTTDEKKAQRQAQPSYQRQLAAQKANRQLQAMARQKVAAQKSVNIELQVKQMMQLMNFSEAQARAAVAAASKVK